MKHLTMEIKQGPAVADGLYLAWTDNPLYPKYPDRKILLWSGGRWCEPYYAEKPYTLPVHGWCGPLPIFEKSYFHAGGPPDAKMYDL